MSMPTDDSLYQGDHHKGEIEIEQVVPLFHNRYIDVYNDSVIFPSGYYGTYFRIGSPADRSVAVLPVTSDGEVILIKTFRHGVRGWGYEVPKGGVDKGETCEAAARRELLEETGYQCDALGYIGAYSMTPDIVGGRLHCYLARNCVQVGKGNAEVSEAIAGVTLVRPEAFAELDALDFQDALTELLILKYLKGATA